MEREYSLETKEEKRNVSLFQAILNKVLAIFKTAPKLTIEEMNQQKEKEKHDEEIKKHVISLIEDKNLEELLELKSLGYKFEETKEFSGLSGMQYEASLNQTLDNLDILISKGLVLNISAFMRNNHFLKHIINTDVSMVFSDYLALKKSWNKVLEEEQTNLCYSLFRKIEQECEDYYAQEKTRSRITTLLKEILIPLKILSSGYTNYSVDRLNKLNRGWQNIIFQASGLSKDNKDNKDKVLEILQEKINRTFLHSFNIYDLDKDMSAICDQRLENHKYDIRNKVRDLYFNDKVKAITTENAKEIIANINIGDIPAEANEKVQSIQSLYSKVLLSKDSLDNKDLLLLESLINKQMPNAITRFMIIDKEYHEELTNSEGKYPKDIMLESLTSIEAQIQEVLKDINQERVHALSVNNRITLSMKR